jgi:hypothetical protein
MSADEQAREVEVRLVGEAIEDAAMRLKGRDLGTVHRDQIAREALAALDPVRAAERQEAARVALLEAAADSNWAPERGDWDGESVAAWLRAHAEVMTSQDRGVAWAGEVRQDPGPSAAP